VQLGNVVRHAGNKSANVDGGREEKLAAPGAVGFLVDGIAHLAHKLDKVVTVLWRTAGRHVSRELHARIHS
jgi:hypothetical protein